MLSPMQIDKKKRKNQHEREDPCAEAVDDFPPSFDVRSDRITVIKASDFLSPVRNTYTTGSTDREVRE